jgi:putative glycosyltransferase (TIGR04372 family)
MLKFISFWSSRQYNQIKKEGSLCVWLKVKKVFKVVLILPFVTIAIPIVLIVRMLKPFVWIRFGCICASRIGHFAFDVEYYLCEQKLGKQPTKTIDLFFYRWEKPANSFFAEMCERQMLINNWAEYLFFANHWLPGGHNYEVLPAMMRNHSRDMEGLFQDIETQLYFTREENSQGQMFLKKIGFTSNDKFVCIIGRDSAYLNKQKQYSKMNLSYHNYRNTDIDTYKDAAKTLVEKGYWVFRMGNVVQKPFNIDHPHILDYANSEYRSDFLDIWLNANCFFCVSVGTGLDEIPRVFRKAAVYVNYLPTQQFVTYDHCISVPKHLIWQDTKKRLTLSEHLLHPYYREEEYVKAKIMVDDLSLKEILDAVLEMESRLTGTWKDTEEDVQLQRLFWKTFKKDPIYHTLNGRIHPQARVGSSFLKENIQWLN